MLRRLSVLGSLLLAACVPTPGPGNSGLAVSCYDKVPTKAEAAAWRSAQNANSAKAYRAFINSYPRSCYVPAATAKLSTVVTKKPMTVRTVPPAKPNKPAAPGKSY